MRALADELSLLAALARTGLLNPGAPGRVARQLNALRRWGHGLPGAVRAAAARSPEQPAIIDGGNPVTYRELVGRSERLAVALADTFGLGTGDLVALLGHNHVGLIEAATAIAMLGCDTVLFNTGLSEPQVASVVHELRPRLVCYDADFATAVSSLPDPVTRLDLSLVDSLIGGVTTGGGLRPPTRIGRTTLLTSGTTGTPRGVRRRTPSGAGPLAAVLSRLPLRVGERVCIAAPISHTWGFAAVQMTFGLRGTVVLRRRDEPAAILNDVVDHGCTGLVTLPTTLHRLLREPPRTTQLRIVAVSGSSLATNLATRFMDQYGEILYNLYGSTEVSWSSIATPNELRSAPGTVGRPPRGTRVRVLGDRHEQLPFGSTGRIFVGNELVSDGYTDGTTIESFGGLFNTGDLGHFDEDGLLYVDGRQDDLVISGGENVYPGPVERCIAALPGVLDVAVIGVPDPEYGARITAYVVCQEGADVDAAKIRWHVRSNLSRSALPRDVVFLDELPRNVTGKVVTRDLPKPPT